MAMRRETHKEELAEKVHKKVIKKPKSVKKVGKTLTKGKAKIKLAMEHFKEGKMHSGKKTGPVVTNPKQAIAVALSMGRKAGARIPKKKK